MLDPFLYLKLKTFYNLVSMKKIILFIFWINFSCVDINNKDDFNLAKLFYKKSLKISFKTFLIMREIIIRTNFNKKIGLDIFQDVKF